MAAIALARLRTVITLCALVALLLVGVTWGWSAVTEPFPEAVETPICTDVAVPAGTKVYPDQVLVSVANAGGEEGLAGRTMTLLTDVGFGRGDTTNAPDDAQVDFAEVWTDDEDDPAAKLVRSWLGKEAEVVVRPSDLPGVTVVVGEDFEKLAKGRPWAQSDADAEICQPPEEADDDEGVTP